MENNQPITAKTAVVIVGAGPIGIELAICFERLGVDYVLLEAQQIGATFSWWPRNTHFFSTPEHLALAGVPFHNLDQQNPTGEQYQAYLRTLVEMFDLNLRVYEPVVDVKKLANGRFHTVSQHRTGQRIYESQQVILTHGGMHKPNKLGISGEDLPHVTHYFPDPHPYFRTKLLIVGGKNSAVEAALRCWRAGVQVSLSYRRPEFEEGRVKPHMIGDIQDRIRRAEIPFYAATIPIAIDNTHVTLASATENLTPNGHTFKVEADFVYLATGFEMETTLLQKAGIQLEDREYTRNAPHYNEKTMETNVSGLFVAGTAAGGTQFRTRHFISTSHDDVARIVKAITSKLSTKIGSVPARNNAVTWEEVKAN